MADKKPENSSSVSVGGGSGDGSGGDSGGSSNNPNVAVPIDEPMNKTWDEREESILKGWAEKAACYQLMHDRSHKRYWCLNAWFAIPIIIFSTITGTGNFAQESLEDSLKLYFIYSIASVNIFTAILQTISQYLTIGQKVEGHRLASVSWDKFSRKIKVELAKDRESRQNVGEFLSNSQETYDRLIEITPSLPADTIKWMNKLIDTGGNSDSNRGCGCIFKCCCFPCGCSGFKCICCKKKYYEEKANRTKSKMMNIEIPEILGKIEPVRVNNYQVVKKNIYSIYGDEAED